MFRNRIPLLAALLPAVALLSACPDNPSTDPPIPECNSGVDQDGDGIFDECDNCPVAENPEQSDADNDGQGDRCDFDDDNDGTQDEDDSCPFIFQAVQPDDADGDGLGDMCDPCPGGRDEEDTDGDGLNDCEDLCVALNDSDNTDSDGDRVGDPCDNCPDEPNAGQIDRDGDGIGDACDDDQPFDVFESDLAETHAAIESGEATCLEIVDAYLARIHQYELDVSDGPPLAAFVELNESVRDQARALDDAYDESGELTGPLHCAVFVVKTNTGTTDTDVTAGSLALDGVRRKEDAWAIRNVRAQGGILLGATGMDEFARGIWGIGSSHGRSGNAYDPYRNSGGSSAGSGVAVGASFALAGTGTDNCASLTVPASYNGLVTIRSTLGLVSVDGIYPSGQLDAVAGPMTRTVADLATMLDAMATFSPTDPRHNPGPWSRPQSFRDHLVVDGLEGKRIGVLRKLAEDTSGAYRHPFRGGKPPVVKIWAEALQDLERKGATIVENIQLPDFDERRYGGGTAPRIDRFLAESDGPLDDYEDLCRTDRFSGHVWSSVQKCVDGVKRGRLNPEGSLEFGAEQYEQNRNHVLNVMEALDLDALVFPVDANGPAGIATSKANCIETSVTGLPSLTVIAGNSQHNPPLPVGLQFMGRHFDESTLFEIAYAYEQATRHRMPPQLTSATAAENVPEIDVVDWNEIHHAIAERALDEVLKDGGKFDLTATRMTNITRAVLEERNVTHLLPPSE